MVNCVANASTKAISWSTLATNWELFGDAWGVSEATSYLKPK